MFSKLFIHLNIFNLILLYCRCFKKIRHQYVLQYDVNSELEEQFAFMSV